MDKRTDPIRIFAEYERGVAYKSALGARGLYEQNRVNERFMIGDQWHGARCGSSRPLVRHNVIKRIGEYKMAAVGAASRIRATSAGVRAEELRSMLSRAGSRLSLVEADSASETPRPLRSMEVVSRGYSTPPMRMEYSMLTSGQLSCS